MQRLKHAYCRLAVLLVMAVIPFADALAASTGMPWEDPLQQILDSITGPVAKVFGVLAIVATGFGFAFSDGGTVARRAFGVVFGLAIVFAATSFFLPLFGFTGGATF